MSTIVSVHWVILYVIQSLNVILWWILLCYWHWLTCTLHLAANMVIYCSPSYNISKYIARIALPIVLYFSSLLFDISVELLESIDLELLMIIRWWNSKIWKNLAVNRLLRCALKFNTSLSSNYIFVFRTLIDCEFVDLASLSCQQPLTYCWINSNIEMI